MKPVFHFLILTGLLCADCAWAESRSVTLKASCTIRDEYVYYLFDLGDNRLVPSARGKSGFEVTMADIPATKPLAGVRWRAVSLSGEQTDWVPVAHHETGPAKFEYQPLAFKAPLKPDFEKNETPYCTGSVFGLFDGIKRVDWAVLVPEESAPFPSDFSIEYTMDSGRHWQEIPSAAFSHFPNPEGCEIWIPLRGLAVDGLRLYSRQVPQAENGKYCLALKDMKVLGAEHLRFEAEGAANEEIAAWNNLWVVYSEACNEIHEKFDPIWPTARPYSGGVVAILATEWAEWNAKQLCWTEHPTLSKFRDFVTQYFVNQEGYVYVDPTDEKHLGYNRHYTTNPCFLAGVSYYILMTGDTGILDVKDPRSGESMRSKMERAMKFLLEGCGGKSGIVTIYDPAADGTPSSFGNNYWDVFLFGYQSAYMNMLFYHALDCYAQLQRYLGNDNQAAEYEALMPVVKKRYNDVFWDNEKGRYISWICKEGKKHDFGCTFVNLPAVRFGLADPGHAKQIFNWLDGRRTISGDTAQGKDIYKYRIAPRANTLAGESDPEYCKHLGAFLNISNEDAPTYGNDIQNGGFIFYVSYYDLMARLLADGPGSAYRRADVILNEFNDHDQLRWQNGLRKGVGTDCGIIREFPESGLVPYFFISGILGIEPVADGLSISPTLPRGWNTARVNRFHFRGRILDIIADRTASEMSLKCFGNRIEVIVPNEQETLFDLSQMPEVTVSRLIPDARKQIEPYLRGGSDAVEITIIDQTYKKTPQADLFTRIYAPKNRVPGKKLPCAVFFCGGGWRNGSLLQFGKHCEYLASHGFVAMTPQYRWINVHGTTPRESVEDAISCIRWVRTHADELGIDPDRIVVGGGSAGGHLAAATATLTEICSENDDLSISCRPDLLVLFNPVVNNGPEISGENHSLVANCWKDISPAHNIKPDMPATVMFHGTGDALVPVETVRQFNADLQKNEIKSRLYLYPDRGHGFFNYKEGNQDCYDSMVRMAQFLEAQGYLSLP